MAITMESAAHAWLTHLQTRKRRPAKPATIKTFANYVRAHIVPRFGNREVGEVGVAVMREFISKLDDASLSAKTVNEIVSCTKAIIASVVDTEGEPLFPRRWNNERLDLPVVNVSEQRAPLVSKQQIESAIATSAEPYKYLYACLAASGLRIGEALAIKLVDDGGTFLDVAAGTIRVRRSVYDGQEQAPKTPAAVRVVEIHKALAAMLAQFAGNREGFLFGNGAPLNESTARKHLDKQLPGVGFHAFRRFRTTTLRAQRVPEDIIRFWLGHSAGSITDRYSKLGQDVEVRREWCEKAGLGFQLQSK